jgi:hypothetical protein
VTFRPGDHLCGFYYGECERDALLLPYLQAGIRAGDKCVAVLDSVSPQQVLANLGATAEVVDSGQVELYTAEQTYLSGGSFDADTMIAFWEERAERSRADVRFTAARVVGEMSWLERRPTTRDALVGYETWANSFAARYPQVIVCLYDLQRLGGGILLDLVCTHPKLLVAGLVLENPHYLSGEEFAQRRGA